MFYFAELLRAKRALYVPAVIVGLFVVTIAFVRLSMGGDVGTWPDRLGSSPTAHVTRTRQSGGSERIVIDDPARKTHAVIVRSSGGSFDMNATMPQSVYDARPHLVMGDTSDRVVNTSAGGSVVHVTMRYSPIHSGYDAAFLFVGTLPLTLIVATMLGGVLSKENDGHLEIAWSKPVSRERYALACFAVDAAAIVVTMVFAIIVALAAQALFFAVPSLSWTSQSALLAAMALAGPLAWYALLTVASASLKRGPGLVMGLGWVAAMMIPGIAQGLAALAQFNTVAAVFHSIFAALTYLDPIAYIMTWKEHGHVLTVGATNTSLSLSLAALVSMVVVYLALSVAQWRRLEA